MFRKNREKRMKKGGQLEDPTLTRLLELEKTFSTKGLSSKEAKELLTEHMDLWSEYKALHNVKSIMGEGHAYTGYSPDGTKFSSGYSGDLGVWPAQFQKSAEKMIPHEERDVTDIVSGIQQGVSSRPDLYPLQFDKGEDITSYFMEKYGGENKSSRRGMRDYRRYLNQLGHGESTPQDNIDLILRQSSDWESFDDIPEEYHGQIFGHTKEDIMEWYDKGDIKLEKAREMLAIRDHLDLQGETPEARKKTYLESITKDAGTGNIEEEEEAAEDFLINDWTMPGSIES